MKKLNTSGFTHLLALAVVVLAVAAFGTYQLVASHANPITTSAKTGGGRQVASVSCFFTTPRSVAHGESFTPSYTVTNPTSQALTINADFGGGLSDKYGGRGGGGPITINVAANSSATTTLETMTITDPTIIKWSAGLSSTDPAFSCSGTTTIKG